MAGFQQGFRRHKTGDAKSSESILDVTSLIVALTEVQDILNRIVRGVAPSESLVLGAACRRDGRNGLLFKRSKTRLCPQVVFEKR